MDKHINIRFYEELNDFLPFEKRKVRFEHAFSGNTSIKDLIEAIGVPHTEIDMIHVNSISVGFTYSVHDGDDISVYPVFESFDIKEVQHLRSLPLREPKFIADVHLGTLAKYLRMSGFDTYYRNNILPEEIANISLSGKRTILTKSTGLLKRNIVTHAYFVRNVNPAGQLKEVVERFYLGEEIKSFSRCMVCNAELEPVEKEVIEHLLPPKVKERQNEFYFCRSCNKAYWRGLHYNKMEKIVNTFIGK